MFDEELCNQGKRLPIKFRCLQIDKRLEVSDSIDQLESSKVATRWYQQKYESKH
jgi:hypothetical protein